MRLPFHRVGLILPACLFGWVAIGQPAIEPRLRGIVHWEGRNIALIEIPGRSGRPIMTILREGERMASWGVVAIDEANGSATLLQFRPRQTNELHLATSPGDRMAGRTFAFEGARMSQVIEIYQEICGRTVIAPPGLPQVAFELKSGPRLSVAEATELLDQKLAAKGIFAVPRGDKFVFIMPQRRMQVLESFRDPPAPDARAAAEVLPAGMIRLHDADLPQVLDVYSELTERVVLHPGPLRAKPVTVRNQTPLTQVEAAWLIESLLLLRDVAVVPEGEKFAFAVPTSRSEPLPKFNPRMAAGNAVPVGLASVRFVDADREQLLESYAGLLGRKPMPVGPEVPPAKLTFQPRIPLNRSEATFVLEALAALNHLKFELVGDRQVKLAPAPAAP